MKRGRILAIAATAVVAILAVSTTLGSQIYAGQTPGLVSFGLIHFAGYLFFLLMPVEALIPVYQAEGHAASVLVAIAVGTALCAQAIDYGVGRVFSDRVIDGLIGEERYERFRARIEAWGGWAILVFNLFHAFIGRTLKPALRAAHTAKHWADRIVADFHHRIDTAQVLAPP